MNKDSTIRIKIARYALLDTLRALKASNIDEISITKEDNDLIMIVDTSSSAVRDNKFSYGCVVSYDDNGYPDLRGCITMTGGENALSVSKDTSESNRCVTNCCEQTDAEEMKK